MMKILRSILSISLFSLVAFTAQAAVINVTSETLYMNSEVTLEYPSGTLQTFRSTYLGSLFSGDRTVDAYHDDHYIPLSGGDYDHVSIDMDAQFEADVEATRTTYWMELETDVYAFDTVSSPDPSKILASAFDYESLIEITMDFYVDGDSAELLLDVHNEGTYAPVSYILDDLTTSTRIASLVSEDPTDPDSAYATLLDGHSYSLTLLASERNHDDDDMRARLRFENAQIVRASVPEPALMFLFSAGLMGLGVVRRGRY